MAAALLDRQLGHLRSRVSVDSGGLRSAGEPMPSIGVSLMAHHGVDVSKHVSTQVTERSVKEADIVLGMTREHARELMAISPEAWSKTFTLKDFVRRAERAGPRHRHQRVADWLESVGANRELHDVLAADPGDDILDPYGRRSRVWKRVIDEMDDYVDRMVSVLGLSHLKARETERIEVLGSRQPNRGIFRLGKRRQLELANPDIAGGASLR